MRIGLGVVVVVVVVVGIRRAKGGKAGGESFTCAMSFFLTSSSSFLCFMSPFFMVGWFL